jgi:hypothetical protein
LRLSRDWRSGDETLQTFGLALVRDGLFVADEPSAKALVAKLSRQANLSLPPDDAERGGARTELFRHFIHLYRRFLRKAVADDGGGRLADIALGGPRAPKTSNAQVQSAVSRLPVELREVLLLVVLGEFTHREAARALDIPLTTVFERLTRARERLACEMPLGPAEPQSARPRSAAPHLRLIT